MGEFRVLIADLEPVNASTESVGGSQSTPTSRPLTIYGWRNLQQRTENERVSGKVLLRVTLFPALAAVSTEDGHKTAASPTPDASSSTPTSEAHQPLAITQSQRAAPQRRVSCVETSNTSAELRLARRRATISDISHASSEQLARRKVNSRMRKERLAALAKTLDSVSENLKTNRAAKAGAAVAASSKENAGAIGQTDASQEAGETNQQQGQDNGIGPEIEGVNDGKGTEAGASKDEIAFGTQQNAEEDDERREETVNNDVNDDVNDDAVDPEEVGTESRRWRNRQQHRRQVSTPNWSKVQSKTSSQWSKVKHKRPSPPSEFPFEQEARFQHLPR